MDCCIVCVIGGGTVFSGGGTVVVGNTGILIEIGIFWLTGFTVEVVLFDICRNVWNALASSLTVRFNVATSAWSWLLPLLSFCSIVV